MIITNFADGQVTNDKLVEFKFRDIKFVISSGSSKLEGTVPSSSYRDVDVEKTLGSGPYKVQVGYVNDSYRADPVTVDSANQMVTFWMAFPAGPNHPQAFVYSESEAE